VALGIELFVHLRSDFFECAFVRENLQIQLRGNARHLPMACLDVSVATYKRQHGDVEQRDESSASLGQAISEFWRYIRILGGCLECFHKSDSVLMYDVFCMFGSVADFAGISEAWNHGCSDMIQNIEVLTSSQDLVPERGILEWRTRVENELGDEE